VAIRVSRIFPGKGTGVAAWLEISREKRGREQLPFPFDFSEPVLKRFPGVWCENGPQSPGKKKNLTQNNKQNRGRLHPILTQSRLLTTLQFRQEKKLETK